MTRLVNWAGGTGEFLARPVARNRFRGLARTHGMWFWVALWAAVAAVGVIALIPVFEGDPPVPGDDVIHRLSGISFMACGLVAWRRRADSAVGPMLTLAGFGVVLADILTQIDSALTLTAALLLGEVWIVVYAALILSFVSGGRLVSTVDRVIVATFFVGLFVVQFAVMLFLDVGDNLLLVRPDADLADALTKVQRGVLIAASLAVAVVIFGRWRTASRPRRRALLPSLGGAFSGVLYAAALTTLLLESPVTALSWILNTALLTVPAALLWGLLRSRLARGGLADLFRELGTQRGVRLEAGLAKTLGDPSLVLAYRVPGERSYLDGAGQPVEPPVSDGARSTAPIERDGRELGMLVYDASLDDDPELVEAVAATAAIALDDARLQAESEDRLAELRASRERIVTAGDAERRRLERNLHDGAQQRLLSVALQLRMVHSRIREDPEFAEQAISSAADELSQSLEELRELARGIHPAVLNHGLQAALTSLASRASVATTVAFDGPERLPEPVELAAYFVACEALANVAKYAQATQATVRVSRRNGQAIIEIADDGVGGADETAGTGLQGLADRVAALDGTLRILSPPGGGTVVTAELPVRVVIADDSRLLREGIASFVRGEGIDVVAEASNAEELLAAVDGHEPDVAIVDIRMPPTQTDEGIQAAHEIRRRHPAMGIMLLSHHVEVGVATQLLAATPQHLGYLLKDRVADPADFAGSLRRVADGGTAIDPQVVSGLLSDPKEAARLGSLSPRERSVLELLAEGRSNRAIGERLAITQAGVQKHVSTIFNKLGLPASESDDRRILAVLAYLVAER